MKIKSLLLSLVFMSSLTMAIGKANAEENNDNTADDGVKIQSFQCGKLGGTFTTFIHFTNPNGQERKSALIKWTKKYITDANWSPEKRCVAVSKRLNDRFQEEGNVNFFLVSSTKEYTNSTTGATESANVICFSRSGKTDENDNSSDCDGVFLTLSPKEDADKAKLDLQSMFAEAGTVAKEPVVRGKRVIRLHGLQNQLNNGWKNRTLKIYRVN